MYPQQFEKLVVAVCQNILGIGVQGFSTGPDGGRDARFIGKANSFPSETASIEGKVIVQAKHTEGIAERFSDSDFSGDSASSILSKEIPRIRQLHHQGEIDHYILFSNRRLGAEANKYIVDRIEKETNVKNAHMVGIDDLDRYIKSYPQVLGIADLDPMDMPLRVSSDDFADIIVALFKQQVIIRTATPPADKILRVRFDSKNIINGLSKDYAEVILRNYLKYFGNIKKFLESPDNDEMLEKYGEVAAEFNLRIIEHRKEHQTFDQLLNYLLYILMNRDSDLRSHKKLTRVMLFYMYWNCDIGNEPNDSKTD